VRETLLVVTIAACAGVLFLIRTPVIGLKDLPEPADLEAAAPRVASAA
jgi:hypothetical protein